MLYLGMYLLTIVDRLCFVVGPLTFLLGIGVIIGTVGMIGSSIDGDDEFTNIIQPWYRRILCSFLLCLSLLIFIPSSKAIAFIYIAPQLIENGAVKDTVKNIPELTKLGTEYLKELLKDKVEEATK
jgi:hypothetical protein